MRTYWLLLSLALLEATLGCWCRELDDRLRDENYKLSDEELGSMIKGLGDEIKSVMTDEMGKLIEDVESAKSRSQTNDVNKEELDRFKDANRVLANDAQARIELAGQKNEGQLTQSGLGSGIGSFMTDARDKLANAGSFLGQHMSSLTNLVPKVRGKIKTIPNALRRVMAWPSFFKYKIKFGKVYKTLREELYGQMIYLRTQVMVGLHNVKFLMGKSRYLQKVTQFADITQNEYKKFYNNKLADSEENSKDVKPMTEVEEKKLKKLAAKGMNVFGHNVAETIEQERRRRRKKRAADELDDDDEESEDIEDASAGFGSDAEDEFESEDLKNELTDEVVDSYAADVVISDEADISSVNAIESIMDNALSGLDDEDDDFEPIDLRETGCLPDIENQWKCGACYAYTTTAAAAYYNCMEIKKKTNRPEVQRFNTRFVSDCGRYLTPESEERGLINGCTGGRVSGAYDFIKRANVFNFMKYELDRTAVAIGDRCAYPRPESIDNMANVPVNFFKESEFTKIRTSQIDLHLRAVGPVWTNIRTWDGWLSHGNGIYDGIKEGKNITIHSVLIVGHKRDINNRDYWIMANSHGIAWGDLGYFRMYHESFVFHRNFLAGLLPHSFNDDDEEDEEEQQVEQDSFTS